jgi:hypothetical protein
MHVSAATSFSTPAQATAQDVSYSLFSFVRFGYEPRKLLATYQLQAGDSARQVDESAEVAVKLLWTMATFDTFYPRLYRHAMAALASFDEDSMPLSLLFEIIIARKFALEHGCGLLSAIVFNVSSVGWAA